jgi:hypothetical protein
MPLPNQNSTTIMSIRITFLVILGVLALSPTANAQTSTHSLGGSVPMGIRTYDNETGKGTDAYFLAQFSWAFRKNLSESENTSFSLGTITSAGAGIYQDLGYTGLLYSGSFQLWADRNKGMGAVPEPAKNSGYHFGLGLGVSYTGSDGESIDEYSGVSIGPMARFGYRFGVYSPKKDVYKAVGVAIFYKHGLEQAQWRTIGFHVLADL